MIRLVNNLLALARMDAGQVNFKTEVLDLSDVILEVIEHLQPLAAAQGVALQVGDLPETLIPGDRRSILQMLNHIVENAIKYSAAVTNPTVHPLVGRREELNRQLAWVRVSDNGVGIPKEHLAHIFDRFYQVDAARLRTGQIKDETNKQASSGTGLGLAIAQWIAQAHHGEIRVESTVGRGSTFEVVLPGYNQAG
jgi:signal transduction histidine kinase